LQSVFFESKEQAKTIISGLKPTASESLFFERKTDYEGKFLFHLKNIDRMLIGESGIFESEAGMENGIKHLKSRITDLAPDFEEL
ncbi:YegP family protein, partial [Maribacter sp.]|nr:YegP family protein [Maribacter sp.]